MSLKDSLDAVTASAPTCRVVKLLDTIDAEDQSTLRSALTDTSIRHADLTKALRKEYGNDAVADKSVSTWRSRNLSDVNGL